MDGIIRILRRFVGTTIFVSFFLLIVNFVLLGTLVFKEINHRPSPGSVLEQVARGLNKADGEDEMGSKDKVGEEGAAGDQGTSGEADGAVGLGGSFFLSNSAAGLLDDHQAWAMLLEPGGTVEWSYHLPQDIPRTYSLIEVAKFSRYYLMEYPVYIWEHKEGLLVVGYPKSSYVKYQFDFLPDWIRSLPLRLLLLLICNVALALLISIIIGTRLIKGIRPLVDGIHSLAREKPVQMDAKGIFSDLAQSVNSTSNILQEKTAALKARDEARSNWIAGISHDIRTPLSMILGYASELEESAALPDEQRQHAAIVRRQGEKLRSLVSDLNLVSMLEYEMQPLHLKKIRLSVLARQVATEFLNDGLDERFEISLELVDEDLHIQGDERLLLRAITNLVHNSVRHNPEGCGIVLETFRTADRSGYGFIVADNGQGIPKEQLPEVTKLPYSAGRKRPVHQGHGLGLPMVARIAEAHQGQLTLDSDQGEGLRATMMFPAPGA
ncbi:sensor histidine kinase [Paenibacillaceae bacterium]|nr:sensor histidine kinase [Paenibacillaceae bacterium]